MTPVAESNTVLRCLTDHLMNQRRDLANWAAAVGDDCGAINERQRRIDALEQFLADRPDVTADEISVESIVRAKVKELRAQNVRDAQLRDWMARRNQERAAEVSVLEAFLSDAQP